MKKKKNDIIESSPDKTDWVQLKIKVPRPLRRKLKEEALKLEETLESYLLGLFDERHETYLKFLSRKELRDSKKRP